MNFWYSPAEIDLAVQAARAYGALGHDVDVSRAPRGGLNVYVYPLGTRRP